MRDRCILDVDSPSYPPAFEEYLQCGCSLCLKENKMTELKPVNFGVNKYCVPAVMSALTGRSTDECAAVISSINGRKEIKAVDVPDIISAFKKLRFDVEERVVTARTLYGVLNKLVITDGLYLVLVPRHIVAIRIEEGNIQICDNKSREPLDARGSARLTQTVERVFRVTEKPQPVFLFTEIVVDKDKYLDRIGINRISRYENKEDDTIYNLGYIKYNGIEELKQIVTALENR